MQKELLIIGALGILLLVVVIQGFQLSSINSNVATGQAAFSTGAGTGQLDMTGWTADEKMNYEMHGIIPARAGGGSAANVPQQVGGC